MVSSKEYSHVYNMGSISKVPLHLQVSSNNQITTIHFLQVVSHSLVFIFQFQENELPFQDLFKLLLTQPTLISTHILNLIIFHDFFLNLPTLNDLNLFISIILLIKFILNKNPQIIALIVMLQEYVLNYDVFHSQVNLS